MNTLLRSEIEASDGAIGKVEDFYIDDDFWIVRYMVADTGGWLKDRLVLLPPEVFRGQPDKKTFAVKLNKQEIRNSPGLEKHSPVSRQYEKKLADHYNYVPYWRIAASSHGIAGVPPDIPPGRKTSTGEQDPNLRSVNEIINYQLMGLKEIAGNVIDLIVDEKWNALFLVIETEKDNKLLPTELVDKISFEKSLVIVNVKVTKILESRGFISYDEINEDFIEISNKYYKV